MSSRRIFVTGIGTEIGKTVVSAALVRALKASYWKPIQAGELENTDSHKIAALTGSDTTIYPESFRLKRPCSPHRAAEEEGIEIRIEDCKPPDHVETLIIEGAGGLMVPINNQDLIIDLIAELQSEVILVSKHYLGSINHTLLSAEALGARGINVLGIIFNGKEIPGTEDIIAKLTALPVIARFSWKDEVTSTSIEQLSKGIRLEL